VTSGQTVGLGTGSTVAHLLPALAERGLTDLRCVATSPATAARAQELGIPVEPFERLARLDVAIDGADQVDPAGWLVKGGGGAHTREKIVAAAADRFIVIADHTKLVDKLKPPIPLELLAFGLPATLQNVNPAKLRDVPNSPDGGLIADYQGNVSDPQELATRFDQVPGVVGHGLFPPALTSDVLVARGEEVEHRTI
jgi:ribose 5-phosphate isomerase A